MKTSRLAAVVASVVFTFSASSVFALTGVQLTNTFEDSVITGGAQSIFASASSAIGPGVEFSAFGSLYDVDLSDDTIRMVLVDNTNVTDLIIPAGRVDRYYFSLDAAVTDVSISSSSSSAFNATATIIAPGSAFNFEDIFGTGLATDLVVGNGGILIEIGEGTNLTNLGARLSIKYTTSPIPIPGALGFMLIGLGSLGIRLRRRST